MTSPAAPPIWVRFLAGTASGAALVIVGHPLDTLRVRLQTSTVTLSSAASSIIREHGVRGFYRGFAPPLFLTGAVNTLLWGSTFAAMDALASAGFGTPTSRAVLAAIPASFVSSLIVGPMELLKTRQQTTQGANAVPLRALLRRVLADEGVVRGLYRGWTMVLGARICGGWAYFGGNTFFINLFNNSWLPPGTSTVARTRNTLLAGGLAGMGYWVFALPFDTVKTRLMASGSAHAGPLACATHLFAAKGVRGFYAGWQPAMLRAFPANAAAFTAFDVAVRVLTPRA